MAKFVPALNRAGAAIGEGERDFGGGAGALAGEADADEAFAVGEDDAAVAVIPGVALVLLHHGELDAVDELQLVEGEAEFLRYQHIDFYQGHAPGVVAAQGTVPLPLRREVVEEALRQSRVVRLAPALLPEPGIEQLLPQGRVVRGQAVEGEGAEGECGR